MSTHPLDCVHNSAAWAGLGDRQQKARLSLDCVWVKVCVYVPLGMWTCGWIVFVRVCLCMRPLQHQIQGVGSILSNSNSNRRRGVE